MLKKIAIACLVLFGLIVLNWWNVQKEEKKESTQEQELQLLSIAKKDIQRLTVRNVNQHWQLIKRKHNDKAYNDAFLNFSKEFEKPSQWLVQYDDYIYPADETQVEALISDLLTAKKEKSIAQGKDQFSIYGLNPEKSNISIYKQGSEQALANVLTGDLNSAQTFLYVANAKDEIYLSSTQLKETQTEAAQHYLKKQIISFYGTAKPEKIMIKNAQGEFEIVQENQQWQLKKPLDILADQLAVEAFINQTQLFEIKDIVVALNENNRKAMLKKYFPEASSIELTFTHQNEQRKLSIANGQTSAGQDPLFYIYRQGHPFIFRSSDSAPPSFYYQSKDWVVKKIFSLDPNNVAAFILEKEGIKKTFVPKDDQWVSEDEKNKEDAVNFGASYALFALKGKAFLNTEHNQKAALDYTVTLKDKDGTSQRFSMYKQVYNKGNLSYRQGFSHAYGTHLLFDMDGLEAIDHAIEAVMNKKEGS